ncbi:hypothetical protein AT1G64795 [Arabidopsis thaliana]|uniref:Uncharacterized protein n=1 Tax=Arabidopsis thaliana TaxID=3702 RepID=A0A1P8APL7_ARATH|nr:uncharacterized protein AT1G64795 [Arabidopsis thaliana]ANM58587.1 hypothetical protein AT1G64795 [Arabidopsis thaliana]|eukprot:NP_001321011.1 hypothetical protein AT1G64795 [Arabidopsis thaliana]
MVMFSEFRNSLELGSTEGKRTFTASELIGGGSSEFLAVSGELTAELASDAWQCEDHFWAWPINFHM